jgi:hypothetical protein
MPKKNKPGWLKPTLEEAQMIKMYTAEAQQMIERQCKGKIIPILYRRAKKRCDCDICGDLRAL